MAFRSRDARSKQEYEADIRKIECFLADAGLDAVWP